MEEHMFHANEHKGMDSYMVDVSGEVTIFQEQESGLMRFWLSFDGLSELYHAALEQREKRHKGVVGD